MGNFNLSGANKIVPEGWYKFRIAKAEEKVTQKGSHHDQYDCIILEGLETGKKYLGVTIQKSLWESPGAAPMNARFLEILGAENLTDSQDMYLSNVSVNPRDYIGNTFWALIENKTDDYGKKSEFKTYSKEQPEVVSTESSKRGLFDEE